MTDKKGFKFGVTTAVKLLVYLLMCMAAFIFGGLIDNAGRHFAPPAAAALITWGFLQFMEGGRRSFFAKGYMLENIFPGAVIGLLAAAVPMAAELFLGRLSVNGLRTGADIREVLYIIFHWELFAGLTFFGYIFHIIQHDGGNIAAVTVSSLLYTAFRLITMGPVLPDGFTAGINADPVYIISLLLTGAAAGLCILNFGDMRSAAAFICLKRFGEIFAVTFFKLNFCGKNLFASVSVYSFLYYEPIYAAVLGVICVLLFIQAVKKR